MKRNAARRMKIVKIRDALKRLSAINREIRYRSCVQTEHLSAGLISFRPRRASDEKQINHRDRDVLCHVLKGQGRLRVKQRTIRLRPGTICHIPKGTPHDFAAGKEGELVLFYSLVRTG